MKKQVQLGDTVQDMVTGLKGVVTGITQWITGCDQAIVQPPLKKDGEKPETVWMDINRCKVSKVKRIVIPTYEKPKDNGGVQDTPTRTL